MSGLLGSGMWDFLFSADFLCWGFDFPHFFFTFCVHKDRNVLFSSFFLAWYSLFLFCSCVVTRMLVGSILPQTKIQHHNVCFLAPYSHIFNLVSFFVVDLVRFFLGEFARVKHSWVWNGQSNFQESYPVCERLWDLDCTRRKGKKVKFFRRIIQCVKYFETVFRLYKKKRKEN